MRVPFAEIPAWLLLGTALTLSGCQLLEKDQASPPIVLHLSLADSLSRYDNVTVVVADGVDTARIIDTVWPNLPLPAPSQIPSRTLVGVRDPFLVRVMGYRSAGQLAVETLIFYEGGHKRVVQKILPPVVPVNTLARLLPSAGILEPGFSAEVPDYRLPMKATDASVSFNVVPTYSKATVTVAGDTLRPGSVARSFTVGTTDDTIMITVSDLGVPRTYRVVVVPPKPIQVELARMEHSTGTLDPPFSPSGDMFNLLVPAALDSVNLAFWPSDPSSQRMFVLGQVTGAGIVRTVRLDKPGASSVVTVTVQKGGINRDYVFFVSRAK